MSGGDYGIPDIPRLNQGPAELKGDHVPTAQDVVDQQEAGDRTRTHIFQQLSGYVVHKRLPLQKTGYGLVTSGLRTFFIKGTASRNVYISNPVLGVFNPAIHRFSLFEALFFLVHAMHTASSRFKANSASPATLEKESQR